MKIPQPRNCERVHLYFLKCYNVVKQSVSDCLMLKGDFIVNEMQLKVWAKLIVNAMSAGDMNKVAEAYGKVSENGTMEDAAKLEEFISALQG